jgi:transposase-like protein
MGVKRQFYDEFKRKAVSTVLEKGIPVKKVAPDLDVHPNFIHQWRRQFEIKEDELLQVRT